MKKIIAAQKKFSRLLTKRSDFHTVNIAETPVLQANLARRRA
jgi:hypothetical protein